MALRKLSIQQVKQISCLENFPSVVELTVHWCSDLERISNVPKLQKLTITRCSKLKILKDVPVLQRLEFEDDKMEILPGYLRDLNLRHLELRCTFTLLTSIAAGESGPEFAKFSHIEHIKAIGVYTSDLYVLYTRGPCSFDTNVNLSFLSRGTLPIFEDAQRLESALKMPRRAFDYVCSLVKEPSLRDMNKYTFLDGRLLCLENRVAIALIVLNSGETPATVGSSIGVSESTVSQVTKRFNSVYWQRRPGTHEMEQIKYKFDKIHGLPNCCGVVHAAHIPFGSQNSDNENEMNDDMLMQIVVDSDMRFTDVELGWSDSKNHLSLLHDSYPFRMCEKGDWLNGTKLEVSTDGSIEVGEYLIGDAGYPLRPWLLTPYQLEKDLSDSEVEFNKRHSEATAIALKALARLKDTWKWLHGGTWRPDSRDDLEDAVDMICRLHNIVIDMEEEGAGMANDQKGKHSEQVRQLADEDAVRAWDLLSQYMISRSSESRVDPVDQEEQEVASEEPGRLLF